MVSDSGGVLGATAGTGAFAGIRTVGEGDDSQVGFDAGVSGSFLGTDGELGSTVNVDTDTSGDGSSQTGVDIGFFGSVDGVRGETGVTVNVDDELDPDGGSQTGIDVGLFGELAGHRAETGVTANIDEDVNPDGTTQTGVDLGVFGEVDAHRAEAVVGVAAEADGDRVEAGVFVRHRNDPDEVRFIPDVTEVGVFAEANRDRVEAGISGDDIELESPTLASAPEREAAVLEPSDPVARRTRIVAELDKDEPTTEVSSTRRVPARTRLADDDVPDRTPDVEDRASPARPRPRR